MNRRGFLIGLSLTVAAPAIVRASSLMSISVLPPIAAKTDIELWNEAMQWATQRPKSRLAADRLAIVAARHKDSPCEAAERRAWREELRNACRDGRRARLDPANEYVGEIDYSAIRVSLSEANPLDLQHQPARLPPW